MIDLRSMEVFYWVVRLGGFGRAAERLNTTQPAISGRIGQIEARLGTRLLERHPVRGPVPTPKGLELHAYAERMLALRDELLARLAPAAGLSGRLRLGAAETLVHTLLGPLLKDLHRCHPAVSPEITVDSSPGLAAALLAGELDLALLLGPLGDPRLSVRPLCTHELVWAASPALALPAGPLDLPELARLPILSYARGTAPHAAIATLFRRPDLPPARIFGSSSLAAIVRMAVDGIGIGVLPQPVIETELAEGRLRLLESMVALPPLVFVAAIVTGPESGLAHSVALLAAELATTS